MSKIIDKIRIILSFPFDLRFTSKTSALHKFNTLEEPFLSRKEVMSIMNQSIEYLWRPTTLPRILQPSVLNGIGE